MSAVSDDDRLHVFLFPIAAAVWRPERQQQLQFCATEHDSLDGRTTMSFDLVSAAEAGCWYTGTLRVRRRVIKNNVRQSRALSSRRFSDAIQSPAGRFDGLVPNSSSIAGRYLPGECIVLSVTESDRKNAPFYRRPQSVDRTPIQRRHNNVHTEQRSARKKECVYGFCRPNNIQHASAPTLHSVLRSGLLRTAYYSSNCQHHIFCTVANGQDERPTRWSLADIRRRGERGKWQPRAARSQPRTEALTRSQPRHRLAAPVRAPARGEDWICHIDQCATD
jgi:hypothetical protein